MMRTWFATALAASLLAGCGGGSSTVPVRQSGPQGGARQVDVTISIVVPRTTSDAKRRPTYVSPSTKSAVVDVTPASGPATHTVIPCTSSPCTGTVPASIGVDTFSIALNDLFDGSGKLLARGSTTATVVEGAANSVNVTFNGVVAVLRLLPLGNAPIRTTTTVTVGAVAQDADFNTIVGPGSYDSPIVFTDSDASGATTLSKTTQTGPNDPSPQLVYNGARIGSESGTAIVTATVPGNPAVKAATTELTPILLFVQYRPPSSFPFLADVALGSDGALWFTDSSNGKVDRITTSGVITEFAVPVPPPNLRSSPLAIAAGGDGKLWFTDVASQNESLQSITTSGSFTRFSVSRPPASRRLAGIVWGPDNNLWVTDGDKIARFTPSGVETDFPTPTSAAGAKGITVGPDGALWFTELNAAKIGRSTTGGAVAEFAADPAVGAAAQPNGITSGPDGALWFADQNTRTIGRMTTDGTGREFSGAGSYGGAIVAAPDGALYFGKPPPPVPSQTFPCGQLGRISVRGTISCFPVSDGSSLYTGHFDKLVVGGDGAIWFIDSDSAYFNGGYIGKISFQ